MKFQIRKAWGEAEWKSTLEAFCYPFEFVSDLFTLLAFAWHFGKKSDRYFDGKSSVL